MSPSALRSPFAGDVSACHSCDALFQIPHAQDASLRCPRCGARIHRGRAVKRVDDALAFVLAAVLLFVLANSFPIVAIESNGDKSSATLLGAALALHAQGMNLVAIVVFMTTFIVPAAELICLIGILWFAKLKQAFSWPVLFRLRHALRPWSMIEIFMLGALVAIVKLESLADVMLGAGLWALGAFVASQAAASHAFDTIEFWSLTKTNS